MKLVNANTGEHMTVGVPTEDVNGKLEVTKLDVGWFFVLIFYKRNDSEERNLEMPVRYMHPTFLFQRVVFFPT